MAASLKQFAFEFTRRSEQHGDTFVRFRALYPSP
jgi:hypothetical protein